MMTIDATKKGNTECRRVIVCQKDYIVVVRCCRNSQKDVGDMQTHIIAKEAVAAAVAADLGLMLMLSFCYV